MLAEAHELLGDLRRAQHEIHAPSVDGVLRHAREAGRFRLLGKRDAAAVLDGPQPERSIRVAARQYHPDGGIRLRLGQGREEDIHGMVLPRRTRREAKAVIHDRESYVGWNHIYMAGGKRQVIVNQDHRQDGLFREQF